MIANLLKDRQKDLGGYLNSKTGFNGRVKPYGTYT
jgi:hypothetical protein